jgi:hypothetical protein
MSWLDECFSAGGVGDSFEDKLRSIPLTMTIIHSSGQSIKFENAYQFFIYAYNFGYITGLYEIASGDLTVSLDEDGTNIVCHFKDKDNANIDNTDIVENEL